jgi:hypothetical protein
MRISMTIAKSYQNTPALLEQPLLSYEHFGKVCHKFNAWMFSIETVA